MEKSIEFTVETTSTTKTNKLNQEVIEKIKFYMQRELFAETKPEINGKTQSIQTKDKPLLSIFNDSIYVEPKGRSYYTTGEKLLSSHVTEFFNRGDASRKVDKPLDKKVCVVLGDPGSGKTTFGRHFMRQCFTRWAKNPEQHPIPLWIPLSRLKLRSDRDRDQIYRGLLTYLFKDRIGLMPEAILALHKHAMQIFLDSYDEINYIGNLYDDNQWQHWPQAQFVIATRPEKFRSQPHSLDKCIQLYFAPNPQSQEGLSVYTISPLDNESIQQFIEQWVGKRQNNELSNWDQKRFWQAIEATPNIKLLAVNPVMLTMLLYTLPELDKEYSGKNEVERYRLEQLAIYDKFVSIWFIQQEKRIQVQLQDYPELEAIYRKVVREVKNFSIKACLHAYTENLAYRCLLDSPDDKLGIEITTEQTLMPALLSHAPSDHVLLNALMEEDQHKNNKLVTLWLKLLRSGCLLRCDENYFAFFHKSLVEYFTQQHIFSSVCKDPAIIALKNAVYGVAKKQGTKVVQSAALNGKLLVQEHNIIAMLAKRAQSDKKFCCALYNLVTKSCQDSYFSIAAANAITILKCAHQPLNNPKRNWQGLRIRGADLSYAILEHVQWQGADLRNVNFNGAYLKNANFNDARLLKCQWSTPNKLEVDPLKFIFSVTFVVFTWDGTLLIAGNQRGKISFFSTETYQCVKTLSQYSWYSFSMNYPVSALAIDGGITHRKSHLLASASSLIAFDDEDLVKYGPSQGEIYLWKLPSGQYLGKLMGHKDGVDDLQLTEDGKKLVSHGTNGTIFIWDTQRLKLIKQIKKKNHLEYVSPSVALSPSGKYIVFVESNGQLNGYTAANVTPFSRQTTPATIAKYLKNVNYLRFSPDERHLAVCGSDGKIVLWSLETDEIPALLSTSGKDAKQLIFSTDGKSVAVISSKIVEWINLCDKNSTHIYELDTDQQRIALSITSTQIAIYKYNMSNIIKLIDVSSNIFSRKKEAEPLVNATLSPQGYYFVSKMDNKIVLFSAETGILDIATLIEGKYLGFATDNNSFFFMSNNAVYQYSLKNRQKSYKNKLSKSFYTKLNKLICSPTGQYVVKTQKGKIHLYTLDGSKKELVLRGHEPECEIGICFSPDGAWLASVSWDKTVRIWSMTTGQLKTCFSGHRGLTGSFKIGHEEPSMASMLGAIFKSMFTVVDIPTCVAFSRDSNLLASASIGYMSYTLFIYTREGKQRQKLRQYGGYLNVVKNVTFDSSGQYLAVLKASSLPARFELHLWDWKKAHCFQCIKLQTEIAFKYITTFFVTYKDRFSNIIWNKNTIRILFQESRQCLTYYKSKNDTAYRLSRGIGTISPNLKKLSLQGTCGLTREQYHLLKAQGSQGNPKSFAHIVNDEFDAREEKKELGVLKRCRKNLTYQRNQEYICPALFEPQKHINTDCWQVILFRIMECTTQSKNDVIDTTQASTSQGAIDFHVYGFIEGLDVTGRSVMIQFDLVEDRNCPTYARIKNKCVIIDSQDLKARQQAFMTMFNREKALPCKLCIRIAGTLNAQQRDNLLDAIIEAQQKQFEPQDLWEEQRIRYLQTGGKKTNMVSQYFSANCLTWLCHILKPYKLSLPHSVWDKIAVNPKYTLSESSFFRSTASKICDVSGWEKSAIHKSVKSFK